MADPLCTSLIEIEIAPVFAGSSQFRGIIAPAFLSPYRRSAVRASLDFDQDSPTGLNLPPRQWLAAWCLYAAFLGLYGCGVKGPRGLDSDAIRDAFRSFQRAVAIGDGAAARKLLAARTLQHYGRLRDAALTATRDELDRQPVAFRYEVLLLRDRLTADELRAHTAITLAECAIARGWINRELIARLRLGNIIHKGDAAEAVMADGDVVTRQRLVFFREGGEWKFDLSATRSVQQRMLERVMDERRLSAEQALQAALDGLITRPFESLWEPLSISAARRGAPDASETTTPGPVAATVE